MSTYYARNKERISVRTRTYNAINADKHRALRVANKGVKAAYDRKYWASPNGRAKKMLSAAKQRAKDSGLEFNLTAEFIAAKIAIGTCPRTGFFFSAPVLGRKFMRDPFSPSIGRIDGTRGYTPDNVEVVCTLYNMMKNEYPESILHAFCEAILRNKGA